jgi:hypothetical protein
MPGGAAVPGAAIPGGGPVKKSQSTDVRRKGKVSELHPCLEALLEIRHSLEVAQMEPVLSFVRVICWYLRGQIAPLTLVWVVHVAGPVLW